MTTNNMNINSIITKYICLFLMVVGISVNAWGTTLHYGVGGSTTATYTGDALPSYDDIGVWEAYGLWSKVTIASSDAYPDYSTYYGSGATNYTSSTDLYAIYYNSITEKYSTSPTSCTSQGVIVADVGENDSKEVNYGALSSFTLSVSSDGTGAVTWESEDENVATVTGDRDGATVTIVGAGIIDITAKVAADATYCAGEDSYTLQVNAVAPTLSHNTSGKALSVSSITSRGATFSGGIITNKGGSDITRYGFTVGTSSTVVIGGTGANKPVASGYWDEDINTNTAFGSKTSVSNFSPNTTYYVRAFAYNGSKYGYSTAVSFTTLHEYSIDLDKNNSEDGSEDGFAYVVEDASSIKEIIHATNTNSGYQLDGYYTDDATPVKVLNADGEFAGTDITGYITSSQWSGTSDITLYAHWTPKNYTIFFNANGGDGSMDDVEKAYNSTYSLPACTFTRPAGKVFKCWAQGSSSGTERDVDYSHTVTGDITFYAVWKDATYSNYRFSCADIEFTGAEDALIMVTSSANNKVRSQEAFHVTGSGLTASTALTFSSSSDKFEFKTASGGAVQTDANGEIDTDVYVFYTPAAGDTNDGLDEPSSLQVEMEGETNSKRRIASLNYGQGYSTTLKGRHLPANFVIAAKVDDKWYALPADKTTGTHDPIEIVVDNATTPTQVLTPDVNVYTLYGQTNKIIGDGYGQYIKLAMHGQSNAPLAGQTTGNTGIGKSSGTVITNDQDVNYWWALTQTNTTVSSSADAKYNMTVANGNPKDLKIWFNGGGSGSPKWGLYSTATNMVDEIRLIPYISDNMEAEVTEWTDDDILVEASPSSKSATKVSATIDDSESSKVTLSDATADSHIVSFVDGEKFTGKGGETLTLNWYNSSNELVAVSWIEMPSIIAAGNTATWSDLASAPDENDIVVLSKPMTVDDEHAQAKQIVMDKSGDNTGKLTIEPNKGLEVIGTVKVYNGRAFGATGEADLVLESSSAGNASLIFENAGNAATVQQYSKASIVGNTWNWQYVGTPFTGSIPQYNYYGSWMYKWNNGGWAVVKGSDVLEPFAGYCLTQESATTHVMGGTLVSTTDDAEVTMAASTDMVLANSWTAPIYIGGFTSSTFTSTPATIYLFNTGMAEKGSSAGTEAGTYVTVPVNAGPYSGDEFIAPMQGFFVTTNGDGGAAGKITMKYDELVRPADSRGIVAGPMKAPKRAQENNRPAVLKMWANGSEYNDRVVILAREDFSEGFDNGWDGKKMSFGSESPSVYVINAQGGYDAVSAIPDLEGTVVGFRAGADNNCTMTFSYEGDDTWYLNDLQAQKSTLISEQNSYAFTTSANDSEVRFIISATPIQKVATGVENGELLNGANGVRKVLINDHIYIIRSGRIFSVDGVMVK